MLGRKHNTPLLDKRHASDGPAMLCICSVSHFDKYQRAVVVAHDQIYFAPVPAWRPIIALQQLQALCF